MSTMGNSVLRAVSLVLVTLSLIQGLTACAGFKGGGNSSPVENRGPPSRGS